MLSFKAGPMGQSFLDSRKFIKGLMGPVGSGKSSLLSALLGDMR